MELHLSSLSDNKIPITEIKRNIGVSYLGGCNTPKLQKSMGLNVLTYGLYLASSDLSGYQVCPESHVCKKYCLNGSGRNKIELLINNTGGTIQKSRIKKTRFFFENKEQFMILLCNEINLAIRKARKTNMQLAVRLNCTSDINPEEFILKGRNILQLYPDIQFYDYSKVFHHIQLVERYNNYDLTFSHDGTNWQQCKELLDRGYRVAVVFEDKNLPERFCGYPVMNGVKYDARFLDKGSVICGLEYKMVANDYKDGKFQKPDTPFIIKRNDSRCEW